MDLATIKALIDLVSRSQVSELKLTEGDTTLRLRRGASAIASAAPPRPTAAAQTLPQPASAPAPTIAEDAVRSPSFGILHLTPSPDAPPFVAVGARVEAGQTLCLIEAMKVFTALAAPRAGTIEAILVASGEEVEAGQVLMRLGA